MAILNYVKHLVTTNTFNELFAQQVRRELFYKSKRADYQTATNTARNLPPFSTRVNSSKFSIFSKLVDSLLNFKSSVFAKLPINKSWSAMSHLFWVKTRVVYYVNNWIYTTNHKRIAVNYFWFVILSGIVGMVLATLIRLEFAYPGAGVFVGDSLQYLSLATAHGVIMVFFMIMPLLFGAFANFLLPTQLGVHDVAFPRLNSAAFWFLPGGLLMLCQLVCVDKRYQRMNCFNIREVQSILKKKFYPDLINSHDYRKLLNETTIGTRYRAAADAATLSGVQVFYNFGVEHAGKAQTNPFKTETCEPSTSFKFLNKAHPVWSALHYVKFQNFVEMIAFTEFTPLKTLLMLLNPLNYFKTSASYLSGLVFKIANYATILILAFMSIINTAATGARRAAHDFFKTFLNAESASSAVKSIFLDGGTSAAVRSMKITEPFFDARVSASFGEGAYLVARALIKPFNVIFFALSELRPSTYTFVRGQNQFKFNETNAGAALSMLNGTRTNRFHEIFYEATVIAEIFAEFTHNISSFKRVSPENASLLDAEFFKLSNLDSSVYFRENKFFNPSIKYNYKSGDYFPKANKDAYNFLFAIVSDLTSLTKTTPWFYSDKYNDVLLLSSELFSELVAGNGADLLSKKASAFTFNPFDGFSALFFELSGNFAQLNFQYLAVLDLNQKFYKMFHTNSLQQRILGNWRQLKFTREAWRCKLLSARHQKTLFRRYVHEDGVFLIYW